MSKWAQRSMFRVAGNFIIPCYCEKPNATLSKFLYSICEGMAKIYLITKKTESKDINLRLGRITDFISRFSLE